MFMLVDRLIDLFCRGGDVGGCRCGEGWCFECVESSLDGRDMGLGSVFQLSDYVPI